MVTAIYTNLQISHTHIHTYTMYKKLDTSQDTQDTGSYSILPNFH